MSISEKTGKYLIVCLLLVFELGLAQEKKAYRGNPTVYPYGGEPDSSRFYEWMERIPLNFKKADFEGARFDSLADFGYAKFDRTVDFRGAKFDSRADFRGAKFDSWADFGGAQFDSLADFRVAQFGIMANFGLFYANI